jgi:hypothetical protein
MNQKKIKTHTINIRMSFMKKENEFEDVKKTRTIQSNKK